MMEEKITHKLNFPLKGASLEELRAGDDVLIFGQMIVARDQAHKIMMELLERGEALPFKPEGQLIFYMGPSPTSPGKIIGSAGPTTAGRMDAFTPKLADLGVKAFLGKGKRNGDVREALLKNKAVYLAATGGVGALLNRYILQAETIAFPELGPEAMLRLTVADFPALVINDLTGADFYEMGPQKYSRSQQSIFQ